MLTGRYGGIGAIIRYDLVRKTVVIDEPYEDTPAAKAGLRKGDVIVSIDDSTMTGKPAAYVSSHLRGDAGSTFEIKIMRPSTGKTFPQDHHPRADPAACRGPTACSRAASAISASPPTRRTAPAT